MASRVLIFILLISGPCFSQGNCEKYLNDYIPRDLDEAIEYFECNWSDSSLTEFKNKEEREAVTPLHFGTGLYIRNNWGLWSGRSDLAKYFSKLGVFHADDRSGIILTSLYRHVNNKEIRLNEQVEFCKAYWARSEKREFERKVTEFGKYNIGDSVEFFYPYGYVSKRQDYIAGDCYPMGIVIGLDSINFKLNIKLKKSCSRKGVIVRKYDVLEKKNGRYIYIERDKIEILKRGKSTWVYYDDWELF